MIANTAPTPKAVALVLFPALVLTLAFAFSYWIAKAFHMFGWLTPGEVKLYDLDGLEEAKTWVAG